ncbi:MAG: hypothetical protein OXQ84_08965 [bacterium]|nr:hypothetical protein [bacterium]
MMPTPQEMCEADGGRYNADGSCSSAAEVQVEELQAQINALRMQLGLAADDDLSTSITDLQNELAGLRQQAADAEAARLEAERKAAEEAAAAMAATAAKLYAGISAPGGTGDDTRTAVYATDDIAVTIGSAAAVNLSEDEDAMVAAHHGWEGMMFTAEPDGDAGMYEAVVYSNIGEPTEGAMFNDSTNGGYTLNADDQIADVTAITDYAGLVASDSFDQSAGTKTFDLAENREYLEFDGTFNGVDGTYICTPTAIATDRDTCGSTVAASGFTLIGGTWMFEPDDPEARLMNVPDADYASYGWWIHKSEDDSMFTASAFAANHGTVAAASGITALQGSAMYSGGAAGKYALRSTTGGTNDAGHFTADVTLEADFGEDTVKGMVDNFTGADGMSRDWMVALNPSTVSDTGDIAGDPDTSGNTDAQMTVWTMGGTAANAAGEWSGNLYENDATSGVPQVATGTFYSEFSRDGRMVGAFGANLDE